MSKCRTESVSLRSKHRTTEQIIARLKKHISIEPTTDCWVWTAAKINTGYGRFNMQPADTGKHTLVLTHRFFYQVYRGLIPEGLEIDHLCRNRACCNPTHLEPVTPRENTKRGNNLAVIKARAAAKTHCCNGHEINEVNTRIKRRSSGKTERVCRVCTREQEQRRRALK